MKKLFSIITVIVLALILVGCQDYVQQDINASKIDELENQIEELKTQIETIQSETQEADYYTWTEDEWEAYLDNVESRLKVLEEKSLQHYKDIHLNSIYIEWLQEDLSELDQELFLEWQQTIKRIQELETYYNSQYNADELMTYNLVRRSDNYVLSLEIEEGIVKTMRLYYEEGWENVNYNQTESIYWRDYLDVINELDRMLEVYEYIGD